MEPELDPTPNNEILSKICYKCKGVGKKHIRVKKVISMKICHVCEGIGTINLNRERNKRKDKNGNFIKKPIRNTYPNFKPSYGIDPVGDEDKIIEEDDEELCYLTGNWRIFQKINKHRYSSDDLVTSYIAIREYITILSNFNTDNIATDINLIDIGCGLGSILLTNIWILLSHYSNKFQVLNCLGVELQKTRIENAKKSFLFNLGDNNNKVFWKLINSDLRDHNQSLFNDIKYDIVTGSPPYFIPSMGSQPNCFESTGCLFERNGGVECYIDAAVKCMRRDDTRDNPAIFIMANTSLTSSRVYNHCLLTDLSIIKRVDVIPKEGRESLFSVFVMVFDEFGSDNYSLSKKDITSQFFKTVKRVHGSVRGEAIENICIRTLDNSHSIQYSNILSFLGKPSSFNKEIYYVNI